MFRSASLFIGTSFTVAVFTIFATSNVDSIVGIPHKIYSLQRILIHIKRWSLLNVPSAPRVCSEPGGQTPVISLSLDRIQTKYHCQVKDHIIDHDIHIFFITETWVHDDLWDALFLSATTPPGFACLRFPHLNQRGSGIGVFHKKSLKINLLKGHHSDACEAVELAV